MVYENKVVNREECEAECHATEHCTGIAHRSDDGVCIVYYGSIEPDAEDEQSGMVCYEYVAGTNGLSETEVRGAVGFGAVHWYKFTVRDNNHDVRVYLTDDPATASSTRLLRAWDHIPYEDQQNWADQLYNGW